MMYYIVNGGITGDVPPEQIALVQRRKQHEPSAQ